MPRNNPDHYKLAGSRKEDPQKAAMSRARLGAQESWKRREARRQPLRPPPPRATESSPDDSNADR